MTNPTPTSSERATQSCPEVEGRPTHAANTVHTIRTVNTVHTIISGGQTGVDRAALDWAIARGIPHGGWCPRGRIALDGVLHARYKLKESNSAGYSLRTKLNVRDADATLILAELGGQALSGGSRLTWRFANELRKPCLIIDLCGDWAESQQEVHSWLREHRVGTLNVAGPRQRANPGVYEQAARFLDGLGI